MESSRAAGNMAFQLVVPTGDAEGLLVITLGRLTRLAKDFGEVIDRDFGTWSLLRAADRIDTRRPVVYFAQNPGIGEPGGTWGDQQVHQGCPWPTGRQP